MPKPSFLLPLLFIAHLATAQQQPLFRIKQKGKTGYINSKGTTVIPPVYHNGFDFAEELAAVRENGLYGFIDTTGKYVITPQFDYATYFVNGITLVYKQRQSYFIDKTGKVVLPTVYRSMKFIDDHKAIITTKSDRQGIIEVRTGRLILDTLYGNISDFNHGVAVAGTWDTTKYSFGLPPQTVIDTAGKIIVPFGKFEYIRDFHDGYASVTIDTNGTDGVIDVTGRLLKGITTINNCDIVTPIPPGYSRFYQRSASDQIYEGIINIKGDTILNDPNYKGVTGFSCGRIIVADHNQNYFILDQHAKRMNTQSFEYIDKFVKNYAIVKAEKGYGIIDTNAHYVVPPKYNFIRFPDATADYFFFEVQDDKKKYRYKYGMANIHNQVIIPPVMENYEDKGFVNGLLSAVVDGRDTWFNPQGNIVWQQSKEDEQYVRPLNIDYIGYSMYRVDTSPEDLHSARQNEYESSSTKYRKITVADHFPKNEIIFTIDTLQPDTIYNQYYTWKLIIGNSSKDTINLLSIMSLCIQLEALDEDGAWKRLEVITYPTHTNGYSITPMAPGTYWPLKIPRFDGSFPTKIRAALWYLDKNKKKQIIYSNAINASINTAQFWRDYSYPEGVYDPRRFSDRIVDMSTVEKDNWGSWDNYKP